MLHRNFALTMMLEPAVLAPVLCQPSLPLDRPGGIDSSAQELRAIRGRLEREDLTVLGYRFSGDRYCTAARFDAYAAALGERFIGRVLPDGSAGLGEAPPFHAVVGSSRVDLQACKLEYSIVSPK